MDVTKQKTTLKQDNCLPEIYRTWAISYRVNKLFLDIDYTGNLYGPMRCYLLGALILKGIFTYLERSKYPPRSINSRI
jgi:outer membrane receptor for ferrienterochelin and colicins